MASQPTSDYDKRGKTVYLLCNRPMGSVPVSHETRGISYNTTSKPVHLAPRPEVRCISHNSFTRFAPFRRLSWVFFCTIYCN